MRHSKWIALLLILCLLATAVPATAEENEIIYEDVESGIDPAETAGEDTGLTVESEDESQLGEYADAPAEEPVDEGEGYAVEAPASDMGYAGVTVSGAPVYFDVATADVIAQLAAGEVVLVTGPDEGRIPVAFVGDGDVLEGYMDAGCVQWLEGDALNAWMGDLAASGAVHLYKGDLNWPLAPLGEGSVVEAIDVKASNYKEYNNDTVFTINGKQIYANMVPDKGLGNCWAWAQEIYKILWGCKFSSDFEGSAATGLNMLRNLSDAERLLTPEHLKNFVASAKPGATIRVSSCTSNCSQWKNDGLSCGHKGHSLIIVDKTPDGVVTMDDHSMSQHTRFYSWQGFCNSWKNYSYVKYIKWPNAPALPPTKIIDGVAVSGLSATYRVRATATKGVGVYSSPNGGTIVKTLSYPDTFAAEYKSNENIDGCRRLYGSAGAGVSGWLALDDKVANVNDRIEVTGVVLSHSVLALVEGDSASLTAAVEPIDATEQGVSWTSSDPSVVSVDGGKLKAVASGTATIRVTTASGSKTAECKVNVTKTAATKVLKKKGSNGTVKLMPGQRLQLTPRFATSKGWKIKSIKSSKPLVASVDASGVVTAVSAGKAKITVTTKNKKKATLTVQVVDPSAPTKVKLNRKGVVKMKVGATLKLMAAVAPSTATTTYTWKSSKPRVATVDDQGNVTAVGKGVCLIGVKTANGKYAKVKIKVK